MAAKATEGGMDVVGQGFKAVRWAAGTGCQGTQDHPQSQRYGDQRCRDPEGRGLKGGFRLPQAKRCKNQHQPEQPGANQRNRAARERQR